MRLLDALDTKKQTFLRARVRAHVEKFHLVPSIPSRRVRQEDPSTGRCRLSGR